MVRSTDSGPEQPGRDSPVLTVWSSTSCSGTLYFCFFVCKMGIIKCLPPGVVVRIESIKIHEAFGTVLGTELVILGELVLPVFY